MGRGNRGVVFYENGDVHGHRNEIPLRREGGAGVRRRYISWAAGGFSLVEMLIYAFLLLLILGVVFRMAIQGRRSSERPMASYRLQQNLMAAQKYLQQDLRETRLCTIRIYPNPSNPAAKPGISMASPRSIATGDLMLTPSGTPLWQKIVYYCLENDPGNAATGSLIRKEGSLPGLPSANPVASAYEPSQAPCDKKHCRTVAKCIYMPGRVIDILGKDLKETGGFVAYFSDAAETRKSATDYQSCHLVNVILIAGETSQATGKLTVLEYPVKVVPRN